LGGRNQVGKRGGGSERTKKEKNGRGASKEFLRKGKKKKNAHKNLSRCPTAKTTRKVQGKNNQGLREKKGVKRGLM